MPGWTIRRSKSIAEIVHEIDLKDEKFGREETAGVRTLINGICTDTHDDEERIARGSVIFDDLYSSFRKKKPSRLATSKRNQAGIGYKCSANARCHPLHRDWRAGH